MGVDLGTVKRVALLSRLKVDEDKIPATENEFNKILKWVEQLNEVDTDHVEPLVSVNENTLVCRDDVVNDGEMPDKILANAPQSEFGYFVVPKVVE